MIIAQRTYQPTLFDAHQAKIDQAFIRFHTDKPEVFAWFKHYAAKLLDAGHKRYSADGILHLVRYHVAIEKGADQTYKINNNFSSRYARMLMNSDARFADFFETRQIKSL